MSCSMRIRKLSALTGVCFAVLPALPTQACLNDRDSDSLAVEGGKLPNVISVITGRFERNPPLFYKMRLARVSREIAANPTHWKLYDDAAVACDRLHDDTAALRWIEKKRAGMERAHVTTATPDGKDAWYRYHANAGTFHAHRFLQNASKTEQLDEMEQGIRNIETALALNPSAHFGRERYQLGAMRWIVTVKRNKAGNEDPEAIGILPQVAKDLKLTDSEDSMDMPRSARVERAIEGLSGLVVLGNAWESVDVFAALAQVLAAHGEAKVGYLAQLRCEELLRSGYRSFDASATGTPLEIAHQLSHYKGFSQMGGRVRGVTNEHNLTVKFAELRDTANRWQEERNVYLTKGLKAGRHPDTTPGFWKDFHPQPPPFLILIGVLKRMKISTRG